MAHCQDQLDALQRACDEKATALVAWLMCEAEHSVSSFRVKTQIITMVELFLEACRSLDDEEQYNAFIDVQWYVALYGPRPLPKHMKITKE